MVTTEEKQLNRQVPKELLAMPLDILEKELRNRKKYYPSKQFVTNIGQQRFCEPYRKRHPESGLFPKTGLFFGGNGVGKTCLFVNIFVGVTMGPEFVNLEWLNLDLFRYAQEIRRKRPLKVRIVCNKADVEPNGSVTQELQKWCPSATMKKPNGVYYQTIIVPAPYPGDHETTVDVKTHDQATTAHAGPDYDFIFFNEPPPPALYAENIGRLRTGGMSMAFLTPLAMVEYMQRIVDSQDERPDGEIVWTKAAIWDNCRDIPGTRGQLSKVDIEALISSWKQINPHEVDAREKGDFMHLAGSVFKTFSPEIHVIDPVNIYRDWNVYHCVDPHANRPHCSIWMALSPQGCWYVIAEYPTGPWDQYKGTAKTIRDFGNDFKLTESGRVSEFPYMNGVKVNRRFGDPLGFQAQSQSNRKNVQSEYFDECQLDFEIEGIDNDIELGHNKIKTFLNFDATYNPKLFIFKGCKNMKRALMNYSEKSVKGKMGEIISGKYEGVWKDWIDNLRYIILTVDYWVPNRADHNGHSQSEYDLINNGGSYGINTVEIDWVV